MKDYNFKKFVLRRAAWGFRENSAINSQKAIQEFHRGVENLEVLKRQAIISQLFPEFQSVMHSKSKE